MTTGRLAANETIAYCRPGLIFLLVLTTAAFAQTQFKSGSLTVTTRFDSVHYQVEVADDARTRSIGLMYRATLPANRGLLLLNDRPEQLNIWMKNTFLPLDIIYIDADGRIVKIVENAEPESTAVMPSEGRVKAVLELNAGQVRNREIAVGDLLTWQVY